MEIGEDQPSIASAAEGALLVKQAPSSVALVSNAGEVTNHGAMCGQKAFFQARPGRAACNMVSS